ncbi:MAG: hypothetical protein ACRYG4_12130 [Janthinobacterium lividum]
MKNAPSPEFDSLADLEATLESLGTTISDYREVVVKRASDERRAAAIAGYFGRRQADSPGRDQNVYRAGSAVEAAGGLGFCDYTLTGFFCAGAKAIEWLAEAALQIKRRDPAASADFFACLRHIIEDEAKHDYLVRLGAWQRWQLESAAYRLAVAEFESSPAGIDPSSKWRLKKVTSLQAYAIDCITQASRVLDPDFQPPSLDTAGKAHDWIAAEKGNPRFAGEPPRPTMAARSCNRDPEDGTQR